MPQPWWAAAVALPVVLTKGIMSVRGRGRHPGSESDRCGGSGSDSGSSSLVWCIIDCVRPGCKSHRTLAHPCRDDASPFVCERVCTSDRLLRKLGSLSKARCRAQPCARARAQYVMRTQTRNNHVRVLKLIAVLILAQICYFPTCTPLCRSQHATRV
jgi:hypothetical protein